MVKGGFVTKKLKNLTDKLYSKWVLQATDANYYGSVSEAILDFKTLIKAIINEKKKSN
jgi:sporulation protein YlmC with PRC-barrel domain